MCVVEPIRDKKKIDDVKRILKENGSRDFLLFLLGINSGLRISDILKLRVEDVKNKDFISIRENKTNKIKKFPITESYRTYLNEFIIDKSSEEWLFASRRGGKPITRIQAYRILTEACLKAGISVNIGTHILRKTFGYHFYQQKKDVALLQCIFNHSSPSITMRYIGITQDMIDLSLQSFGL